MGCGCGKNNSGRGRRKNDGFEWQRFNIFRPYYCKQWEIPRQNSPGFQKMKKFTSEVVIGLEIHVELDTDTKLFCVCPTKGNEEPNTRVCEVCLGHPGSKPVLNKKAVEYAIK